MIFTFSATADFDFLTQFSRHIDVPIENDSITIPERLGEGFIQRLFFGPEFKITIHRYILKEDLIIKRNALEGGNNLITIFFYSNEQPAEIAVEDKAKVRFSQRDESAVHVISNDLSSTVQFPANHQIHYVVIGIRVPALKKMLAADKPNPTLQRITGDGNSFLFFESMSVEARQLLKNLAGVNLNGTLSRFYTQIKVQELLYVLFHQLCARESAAHQQITSSDAEKLLHIRNEVVRDLSAPPVLAELAGIAAMSETKLKQLFKQTFGSTIYNYFQQARMEEAAFLLKQGTHTVAEVGYELGFSNLSHFSRVFENQFGMAPKKFSQSS